MSIDVDKIYAQQDDDFLDGAIAAIKAVPKKSEKKSGQNQRAGVKTAQRERKSEKKRNQ